MQFETLDVSKFKDTEQNIQAIKAWADNLIDSLQVLSNQIDELQKAYKKLESEGE